MVEPAIFFLIGFLTAAFLALLAAPAISHRARRLAAARARLQSPLSETQARAERDALRGQHAVEMVRLEARVKAAEDDRAIHRAEIGRHASRIVTLEDVSAERAAEIARQRAELRALETAGRDMEVQLATQEIVLRDFTFQRDAANRDLRLALARIAELEMRVDENRAVIASADAQAESLQVEISNLRRAAVTGETERARVAAALAERIDAATRLRGELETASTRFVGLALEFEGRVADSARLRSRLEEVEPRLARSEAAREEAARENNGHLALLAEREAAIDRAAAAHHDLTQRMTTLAQTSSAKLEASETQIQALTTSQATMEGALRAARSERVDLQREIERLKARLAELATTGQSGSKGDQALRQSIARLGRDITRGRAEPELEEPAAGQIMNFARREPTPPAANFTPDSSTGATLRQDEPIASER